LFRWLKSAATTPTYGNDAYCQTFVILSSFSSFGERRIPDLDISLAKMN
jgi:hypothetical protein